MSDLNKLITDAQNYNKAIDDAEAAMVRLMQQITNKGSMQTYKAFYTGQVKTVLKNLRKPIPEIKDKRGD